ncbi:hypothetical protein FRB90_012342 [Tulasnella sp. 427]|nr:hypothetical protein FRB90_012342 [Tulasnella sp. 427]
MPPWTDNNAFGIEGYTASNIWDIDNIGELSANWVNRGGSTTATRFVYSAHYDQILAGPITSSPSTLYSDAIVVQLVFEFKRSKLSDICKHNNNPIGSGIEECMDMIGIEVTCLKGEWYGAKMVKRRTEGRMKGEEGGDSDKKGSPYVYGSPLTVKHAVFSLTGCNLRRAFQKSPRSTTRNQPD